MASVQGEKAVVVEVVHTVYAIMTGQAGGAKLLLVGSHEVQIGQGMAGDTNVEINRFEVGLVAIVTLEDGPGKIGLVMGEAETGLGVVIENGGTQGGGGPGFRGMAGGAIGVK